MGPTSDGVSDGVAAKTPDYAGVVANGGSAKEGGCKRIFTFFAILISFSVRRRSQKDPGKILHAVSVMRLLGRQLLLL